MIPTVRLFGRLLVGSDTGFAGKVSDVASIDTNGTKDDVHTGTIATVTREVKDGRTLARKRIRSGCHDVVMQDVTSMRAMSTIGSHCGVAAVAGLDGIATDLECELDMAREREQTHMLRAVLQKDHYTALRVRAPEPVDELSTDTEFVYEYTEGEVLHARHGKEVIERYIKAYFLLLHIDGIVILDPRRQNVIVEDTTGDIVIIDAGSTRKTTAIERDHNRRLHIAATNVARWKRTMGGQVSESMTDAVMSFCKPFWNPEVEFPSIEVLQTMMKDPSALTENVNPSVVCVVRSFFVMCHALAELGCKTINVKDCMEDIKQALVAHYTRDAKKKRQAGQQEAQGSECDQDN
jgi:predicted unusual protein kinase regulating ubiquinone biosynthesis (AarF/ABC1/UbiB family)